jgi:hypothetical protein
MVWDGALNDFFTPQRFHDSNLEMTRRCQPPVSADLFDGVAGARMACSRPQDRPGLPKFATGSMERDSLDVLAPK